MANDISASADVIDVRDIIERFEELETELQTAMAERFDGLVEPEFTEWVKSVADSDDPNAPHNICDDAAEFLTLQSLLEDLAGNGGNEQWRGDWYPVGLIADSYFRTYARELADDIGAVNRTVSWPHTCIDWAQAARELQVDYSSVEFDGSTFWYR